jgi:hypothetical protein
MKRIISAIVAAACIPCINAHASDIQVQTEWCELSDIVAMARIIAEDPDAPSIREGIRMDANCDGIVDGSDIAVQLQHMELRPLYDAIMNDIERSWLESCELFGFDNPDYTATITVCNGEGYGTALSPEPWLNGYDYTDYWQAGDIVLQLESSTDYMEVFIANSIVYGHKFS